MSETFRPVWNPKIHHYLIRNDRSSGVLASLQPDAHGQGLHCPQTKRTPVPVAERSNVIVTLHPFFADFLQLGYTTV